jgi:acetyl esterase/lipase
MNTRNLRGKAAGLLGLLTIFAFSPSPTWCGEESTPPETLTDKTFLRLWPGPAPGAQGETLEDIPAVQVFLPKAETATGASIVVCPGGAYGFRAGHEGATVGEWLAANGITGFVLRYRLGPKYHHPVELGDAQRAVRYVRANAATWKLDPKRIGIIGFSAGGHLASSAATHYTDGDPKAEDPIERVLSRPDLQILVYPVITMGAKTHGGSRNNLLGKNPAPELLELLSNEKQVNARTPPAFLVHSTEDKAVPVENSDLYAAALKAAGVPCEYVRGSIGGHGFGLQKSWTEPCLKWLRAMKF